MKDARKSLADFADNLMRALLYLHMMAVLAISLVLLIPSCFIQYKIVSPIFPREENGKISKHIKKGFVIQFLSAVATAVSATMLLEFAFKFEFAIPELLITLLAILFSPLTLFMFLPLTLHQLRGHWDFKKYKKLFYGASACAGISSVISVFYIFYTMIW